MHVLRGQGAPLRFSQNVPIRPAGQLQAPLTWSHVAWPSHRHWCRHPGPNQPVGHSAAEPHRQMTHRGGGPQNPDYSPCLHSLGVGPHWDALGENALCWHSVPVKPASQLQRPVSASQVPSPFTQSQVLLQSGPQDPASQAAISEREGSRSSLPCVQRQVTARLGAIHRLIPTFTAVQASPARGTHAASSGRVALPAILTLTAELASQTKLPGWANCTHRKHQAVTPCDAVCQS